MILNLFLIYLGQRKEDETFQYTVVPISTWFFYAEYCSLLTLLHQAGNF